MRAGYRVEVLIITIFSFLLLSLPLPQVITNTPAKLVSSHLGCGVVVCVCVRTHGGVCVSIYVKKKKLVNMHDLVSDSQVCETVVTISSLLEGVCVCVCVLAWNEYMHALILEFRFE